MQLLSERVGEVNDDHLPVGLAAVDEGEDAQGFDVLDVACAAADVGPDLDGVEGVVVAFGEVGFGV